MRILVIVSLIFLAGNGLAQTFTGEIQAGIAGTQVSGDQLSGFDKGGIIGGAGVRLHTGEKNSFGFRILYFQKGSRKASDTENGDPTSYLLRLNYIEVPVTWRTSFYKKFFLEAGPSIGILTGSSEEDQDGELPLRKEFNSTDLSATLSLGYPISPKFDFLFSYFQSLLPVRSHSGNAVYRLNQGQYNSAITFTFIYKLKGSRSE